MFSEANFVFNHALSLQIRFKQIYGKVSPLKNLKKHFVKRIKRTYLNAVTRNSILNILDRQIEFHLRHDSINNIKFKTYSNPQKLYMFNGGFVLKENRILFKKIHKEIKYFKSRDFDNACVKSLSVSRDKTGNYFIHIQLVNFVEKRKKINTGQKVGIDFGIKKYLTLSNGQTYDFPRFLEPLKKKIKVKQKKICRSKKGGKKRLKEIKELNILYKSITNKRNDYQWKLANELCRLYDCICIEDLDLKDISASYGKKMNKYAHGEFLKKLLYLSKLYGVIVHKINRYYPSSKTCSCGYINKGLKIKERKWICPQCGAMNDRDLLAANNILRRGIYEMESDCKT